MVHLLFLETLSNRQYNYLSFLYHIRNRCFYPCTIITCTLVPLGTHLEKNYMIPVWQFLA